MLRYLFATAALLTIGGVSSSAALLPCASGSLTSYIALGTAGCLVGTLEFGGFESLPADSGTTSIAASSITVAPITAGLTFTFNQTATAFAILDSVFGFNVNVLNSGTLTGETLTLNGSSETGFGDLDGIGYSCKGAVSATGTCSSSAARNLGVDEIFGTPQFTDQVSYAGLPITGQKFDLTADSSSGGTATLGSASITFTSAAAPEPSTLLLSAGVLALAFFGRKTSAFASLTESLRSKR